ncbi:MAG: aminodeoxychorismate/anthranilate synthase component II [Saprospiraceae bacterium]|nr:aminodeoxychorismate/anthranilate synthase component II [Saprospiraceae bacterium]
MKSPKILIIDNDDSFTFNLLQLFESAGAKVEISKGSSKTPSHINDFHGIVFSPGPGVPSEFPKMFELLNEGSNVPILGICLGMQAIASYFGAKLYRQDFVQHGQVHEVQVFAGVSELFQNLPQSFEVGLYHSWAVDPASIPDVLRVSCMSSQKVIMGLRHRTRNIEGFQFHPESFLTPYGKDMITNWLLTLSV